MPFDSYDTSKRDINLTGFSMGPSTGFTENVASSFNSQQYVESTWGHADLLHQRYSDAVDKIREETGEDLSGLLDKSETLWRSTYSNRARRFEGLPENLDNVDAFAESLDKIDERLSELNRQFPDRYDSPDQIWEAVKQEAERLQMENYVVADRASALGTVGQFVGGVAGSFTGNDPLNIASLFLNPGGKGLTAVAREGALGLGVESVNQLTGVRLNKNLLGVENTAGQIAANILFAGAGAAAFRGVAEGAGPGYRALEKRIAPDRARARELRDIILDAADNAAPTSRSSRGSQRKLRQDVYTRQYIQDDVDFLARNNPIPRTPEGDAAFIRMVSQAYSPDAATRTDTAVAQLIPDAEGNTFTLVPGFDQALAKSIEADARKAAPQLYEEMDSAGKRVAELDEEIEELSKSLHSVGDVVEQIDEVTGQRIKDIEKELDGKVTVKRRNQLESELDLLVAAFPEEQLSRQLNIMDGTRRRKIKRARASRKAAKRRYNDARSQAQQTVQGLADARKAELSIKAQMQEQEAFVRLRDNVDGVAEMHPLNVPGASPDTVRAALAAREAAQESVDIDVAAKNITDVAQEEINSSRLNTDVGEALSSDPLLKTGSKEYDNAVISATLDDGTTTQLTAKQALGDIRLRMKEAKNLMECLNAT